MDSKKANIREVVGEKLCNSCGACFAVCKPDAIVFKETVGGNLFPQIDTDKCTYCGLCLKVCQGVSFSDTLFDKMPRDVFRGESIKSYLVRAQSEDIFKNSQSGGAVSALLCYALESGLANAAVTVAMQKGNPPRANACLVRSREEILHSQKSKYSLVPALSALKGLKESDQKIVFVGLPCQIHGLHNLYEVVPELKEKIILTIGLFCDRTMTNAAIDYLIKKQNCKGQVKHLVFRDKQHGGYPGSVYIESEDGKDYVLPPKDRMQIKDFFTPTRCRLCFDKLNIFSDISVGDPWGISEADHINGESVCVARTDKGANFLQKAKDYLRLREVNYDKIYNGQNIEHKQDLWCGYKEAWRRKGLKLPNYCEYIKTKPAKPDINEFMMTLQKSLDLDSFGSREELIRYVDSHIPKQRRHSLLLTVGIFCLKAIQKMIRSLKK